jgi:hypothetical protein
MHSSMESARARHASSATSTDTANQERLRDKLRSGRRRGAAFHEPTPQSLEQHALGTPDGSKDQFSRVVRF